jgi:hypothetical protein
MGSHDRVCKPRLSLRLTPSSSSSHQEGQIGANAESTLKKKFGKWKAMVCLPPLPSPPLPLSSLSAGGKSLSREGVDASGGNCSQGVRIHFLASKVYHPLTFFSASPLSSAVLKPPPLALSRSLNAPREQQELQTGELL